MKKYLIKLVARITVGIFTATLFAPTVFAQGLTCDDLNLPDKQKDYIVTILEEEIAGATSDQPQGTGEGANQVITCFRETTCTQTTDGDTTRTTCDSEYKTSCQPSDQTSCQRVQALISQSGVGLLMAYLGIIYRWAAGIIGVISVVYMIWGGLTITMAQDDTSSIDKAKEKIFQSIAGLVLLFLSAIILYTINPNFFTFTP